MANKQIDMRKVKTLFKLHSQGVSKRQISSQLGISRNTVSKYISFFKAYKLTAYEVGSVAFVSINLCENYIFGLKHHVQGP